MMKSNAPQSGDAPAGVTGRAAAVPDAPAGHGEVVDWPVLVPGRSWRVASSGSGDQVCPAGTVRNEPYRRRLHPWLSVNGGLVQELGSLRGAGCG